MKIIHRLKQVGVRLLKMKVLYLFLTWYPISNGIAQSFGNMAIGGGGFVSAVYFSTIEQNVLYAQTDVGGAYRWNDTTQSWTSMMDWVNADEVGLLGVEALASDPSAPGTVYMMTGTLYWNAADDGIGRSYFFRSNDYGSTWEKIPVWDNSTKYFNIHGNGMGRGNGCRLAIDPANSNTLFYGSRNKGLWKTTDNGDTWAKVNSFPVDTTWNGCGISFVAFDKSTQGGSQTNRIYVGVLRKTDNLFVSEDAGTTWTLVPNRPYPQYATDLMPQRIEIYPDGSKIITTWGNGAGPHSMLWNEGWGDITERFNRGAVFEYTVGTQTWNDISPENLIDPDGDPSDPATSYGCYSGVSIDPNNPGHMVVSSINSYRGTQYWLINSEWKDFWGDNIFVTEDSGQTWVPSFRYYWVAGGNNPAVEQLDENGIPWLIENTIHWIGCTAIDPYNPQRVFVTSGNGVFKTENIFNYQWSYVNQWGGADTTYTQSTVWQAACHGIEEVVPQDIVSIPGGPVVSVIADYDGFMHDSISLSPTLGRHKVSVSGSLYPLGTNTGIAYAPQNGKLAKCAGTRYVNGTSIGPVQWSTDSSATWTTEVNTTDPPTDLNGGKVALSADGDVTLWMPSSGIIMYRNTTSGWTTVSGISFNGRPVGDQVDANLFYVFNKSTGYIFVSTDKGVSFSQAGYAGTSNFGKAVAVPGNAGHVYIPVADYDGTGSLMYSVNGGATFSAVSGVGYCEAVGFGKAYPEAAYPTIYVFAKVNGVLGVYRSTDQGITWVRINDDQHEYGGLANGEFVVGDMNVYGRVYMSTAGNGIVYIDSDGIPSDGGLPIRLTYFNANYNLGSVVLNWQTASEENNDYFTIERSVDAMGFESILTIGGASNSSVVINYSAIDEYPVEGVGYYRLKQTDYNGNFSYSQIEAVQSGISSLSTFYNLDIYPNPYKNGRLTLNMQGVANGDQVITTIMSANGQVTYYEKGIAQNQEIKIQPQLKNGFYVLSVITGNSAISKKLIVE